jgi:hypothetical protein
MSAAFLGRADGLCYGALVALKILEKGLHPSRNVDPFGQLPCDCDEVCVYITNGESIGDDLLECPHCHYVLTLRDLFAAMKMPPGVMPPG